ncbi:E3 ubiquitin-protein ligase AMFR-like [Rhizophagus clarus]|uniref:E3 ubiquitin-protein ligase AMFR-like n=1 Tax=Rhizophagus clarus TaxID=94130 RepID=A0A8H3QIX0_9GLOM|nr:E3 ubiquitin-protein ligase AMFR-like [Rhizophagus clarus]
MPVLDLKLYTTISICVALVAFIYSCNIFTIPISPQKWFPSIITPVVNSPNQVTHSEPVERQTPLNSIDKIWSSAEKSPGATSIFQSMLSERILAPRKPVMGPFLTSLVNFLQKEKICIMIFINMAYCFLFLLGRFTLKFFFGELRVIESQHMYDRLLNFLLFKVVFVGAILEPKWEELLIWTSWFTILGFLRIFSMLCRDRFEYLTFSPNTPVQAHLRILVLLILILLSDIFWFIMCISIFRSMLLLLTFECFTLFLDTVQTLIKYLIHLRDITRQSVWESRGILLYYTEFVTDTLILVATLGHYLHIMLLHGISFTLIDAVLFLNMRSVFNNLRKKIIAYCNYRQAISNMQTQYPNATDIELKEYNDDCAICRDSMDKAKKLPCGHMFHLTCLRSWLEHHSSCPTCRRSLLKIYFRI